MGTTSSRFENRFSLRKHVAYYVDGKLETTQILDVYSQLEGTNFSSLYAATSPSEDFAESFATYVHKVLMGKPFEIRIDQNGQNVKRFESCWEAKRCSSKRRVLEGFIGAFRHLCDPATGHTREYASKRHTRSREIPVYQMKSGMPA